MDFVSVWKAVSIVLTGAFGMLGLLKSFKDKDTDKITPWGWVSLIGIVLSTSFGTAAQLVESSDAAQRSLAISTKTEQGLLDLKRILSPFDVPTIAADFKIDCSGKRFRAFCKRLARSGGDGSDAPDSVWRFWPGGAPAVMPFQIAIFKDAKTESEFAEGEQDATPDVQFAVAATSDSGPARLVAHKSDKDEWMLSFSDYAPAASRTSAAVLSLLDLKSAVVLVYGFESAFESLVPNRLTMVEKNGYVLYAHDDDFHLASVVQPGGRQVGYLYRFSDGNNLP